MEMVITSVKSSQPFPPIFHFSETQCEEHVSSWRSDQRNSHGILALSHDFTLRDKNQILITKILRNKNRQIKSYIDHHSSQEKHPHPLIRTLTRVSYVICVAA